MSNYLNRKAPPRFNANLSLLKAFTAYIKCTKFPQFVDRTDFAQYTFSCLMSSLQEALAHANQLGEDHIAYAHLDQLARCIPQMHAKTGQASLNVWGNPSNPVSLFFWEPVIDASHVGYFHHVLLRLPDYFPTFKAPAESRMIFCMVISLATMLEPQEQMGWFRRLLRASAHPIETYCDSFSIVVPQDAVRVAWEEMLQKVMPLDLTLMPPGSLSSEILDAASWNLKWTLESGLFTLMLQHGADSNAAVYGEVPSYSAPAWINFVLSSFCISPESSSQALYLQVLDCFIAAGADMSIAVPSPNIVGSQPQNMTGLDLFLEHLSQSSAMNHNRMNHHFLLGILERLLNMAKATGTDYLPTLQTALPPQILSTLKRSFWRAELEMSCWSPYVSPQTMK